MSPGMGRASGDGAMAAALDRLACDELSPAERSEVLRWLEADSRRWRSCALAFLEAQTWRKALRAGERATPIPALAAAAPAPKEPALRGTWLAIAAATMAAFVGGWGGATLMKNFGTGARERAEAPGALETHAAAGASKSAASPDPKEEAETVFASFALAGSEATTPRRELKVPVSSGERDLSPVADAVISEDEQKRWERQGFRVSKIREYVPGKLPDGQPVMLSVDRLRVERIGAPML